MQLKVSLQMVLYNRQINNCFSILNLGGFPWMAILRYEGQGADGRTEARWGCGIVYQR